MSSDNQFDNSNQEELSGDEEAQRKLRMSTLAKQMEQMRSNPVAQQPVEPMVRPMLAQQSSTPLFQIPVELAPLPSNGLVYPPNSALHMKKNIEIREITAKEEDILTSPALLKKGTFITELVAACLVDKSIDVRSMLAADKNSIFTTIRAISYGTEYNAEVACTECGVKQKQEFDLLKFDVKRLDIEPVRPGINVFEFELPNIKKKVFFKFLTVEDEESLIVEAERKKKLPGHAADASVTTSLMYSILQIDVITDRSELTKIIRNLPGRDSVALRKYIEKHTPGLKSVASVTCGTCLHEFEADMPMAPHFLWPNVEKD